MALLWERLLWQQINYGWGMARVRQYQYFYHNNASYDNVKIIWQYEWGPLLSDEPKETFQLNLQLLSFTELNSELIVALQLTTLLFWFSLTALTSSVPSCNSYSSCFYPQSSDEPTIHYLPSTKKTDKVRESLVNVVVHFKPDIFLRQR